MAAKTAKKKGDAQQVIIAKPDDQTMRVTIFGETPLIVHSWSHKARMEMLQKHMREIVVREAKDPTEHFERSMYRMEDGTYGFPVVGIKRAMATAAVDLENIDKAQVYRNIRIAGERGFQQAAFADLRTPQELAHLYSPNAPTMREDMVRLSGMQRTPDLRYRAEYWPWAMRFQLRFLTEFITAESLLNLLHGAGLRVGLGEWRQERAGTNGAFHVASAEETKLVEKWIKAGQKEPVKIDAQAWLASVRASKRAAAAAASGNGGAVVADLAAVARRRGRPRKTVAPSPDEAN